MNRIILAAWAAVVAGAIRMREWPVLTLGTWNVGNGTLADLFELLAQADALAGQEFGDRQDWIAELRRRGYGVIEGDEPGQGSTPMIYGPRLQLLKVKRWLLAPAQKAGRGAGPDTLKQKWLIGGLFLDLETGRKFSLYSVHYVASQQFARRRGIAVAMTNRIRLRLAMLHRAVFIMGDFNIEIDSEVGRLLLKVLNVTDRAGGELDTHGHRSIDLIWWTVRRWIRFVAHRLVRNRSDHHAKLAEFAIRPKRKRNR